MFQVSSAIGFGFEILKPSKRNFETVISMKGKKLALSKTKAES